MIGYLPIAILAYALNAGSIIIDKILLQKSIPNPIAYAFFISVLGLLTVFLIPFGFILPNLQIVLLCAFSGVSFTIALFAMFTSLKNQEASIVGPIVGALNPLFTIILGFIFFAQLLSSTHIFAILILVFGALVIGINFSNHKFTLNKNLLWMVASGAFFALSYVLLREAFLQTNFMTGLILSRLGGGLFVLFFLLFPNLRQAIFTKNKQNPSQTKITAVLLFTGQIMGAIQGLLLTYAVSLTSPALVNSLFGVQYIVILIFALLTFKEHPEWLGENLGSTTIFQKIMGVVILSIGLYLLSK